MQDETKTASRPFVYPKPSPVSAPSNVPSPLQDEENVSLSSSRTATHLYLPNRPVSKASNRRHFITVTGQNSADHKSHVVRSANPDGLISVLEPWRYQLAACLLSVLSFICLVIMACIYSTQPLTQWPSSIISINGVVAALTTVMKGALMIPVADTISQAKWAHFSHPVRGVPDPQLRDLGRIDQASRGAWGSAKWIVRHSLHTPLINLGALLTLLALAFDLFSQQIVTIEVQPAINASDAARVPWVQNVSATIDSVAWRAALYDGFLNPDIPDLPVACPSGNCSWDSVPTVGVCGTCVDHTPQINCSAVSSPQGSGTIQLCNYTGTLEHTFGDHLTNTFPPNQSISWSAYSDSSTGFDPQMPVAWLGIGSYDTFYEKLNMTEYRYSSQNSSTWGAGVFEVLELPTITFDTERCSTGIPTGTLCGFWFCMPAVTADVILGQTNQRVKMGSAAFSYANQPGFGQHVNMYFHDNPGFNMQGRNFSVIDEPGDWAQEPVMSLEASYSVDRLIEHKYLGLLARWNETRNNRTKWVNGIAKSLSNVIRRHFKLADTADDPYAGIIWVEQAVIVVKWRWITYPACMIMAGLALFAANVWQTYVYGRSVWIDSSIVPLLAKVDQQVIDKAQGATAGSAEQLNAAVGSIRARMESDREGWVFRNM
jgi:hypothetical protein